MKALLQCYKCQRFEHAVGSSCGKRRCAKCGEEHEIKECTAAAPTCCNCAGDHMVGYRECEHFIQARRVQRVRDQHKVTHAEAVERAEGVLRVTVGVETCSCSSCSEIR